jgi:starch synthase
LRKKIAAFDIEKAKRAPMLALVSRLTEQKIRLMIDPWQGSTILDRLLQKECTLVVLGKGNLLPAMEKLLEKYPNALLFGGFDDDLEKRLYAAADFMLMPSEFEPCGTSQMKAMRYGCLPVAAAVGGLIDTIIHEKNGFLFSGKSREEKSRNFMALCENLLKRAAEPGALDVLRHRAMTTEFSWPQAAAKYLPLLLP